MTGRMISMILMLIWIRMQVLDNFIHSFIHSYDHLFIRSPYLTSNHITGWRDQHGEHLQAI